MHAVSAIRGHAAIDGTQCHRLAPDIRQVPGLAADRSARPRRLAARFPRKCIRRHRRYCRHLPLRAARNWRSAAVAAPNLVNGTRRTRLLTVHIRQHAELVGDVATAPARRARAQREYPVSADVLINFLPTQRRQLGVDTEWVLRQIVTYGRIAAIIVVVSLLLDIGVPTYYSSVSGTYGFGTQSYYLAGNVLGLSLVVSLARLAGSAAATAGLCRACWMPG